MTPPVLEVRDLDVVFGHGAARHHVLRRLSLTLPAGRTLGLVGESGSGKSTIAKAVVGVVRPAAGQVLVDGADIASARGARLTALRRRVQMIPQDPYASLNPRLTVAQAIAEAIDPRRMRVKHRRAEIEELLNRVALDGDAADRYPHEFSGGQRQRVAIARALATRPDLVIADEVTSALDCSVQAEVLGVLRDLRRDLQLTMLFISHDLAVVRHVSDEVAVLYRGKIVERAPRNELFGSPQHDYTCTLLNSVPDGGPLGPRPDETEVAAR